MSGRPRTSTLLLAGLFLAMLALYILVRPVPAPAGSPEPAASAVSTPSPARSAASPTRSPSPSHTPHEPFAPAGYVTNTQPVTIHHERQSSRSCPAQQIGHRWVLHSSAGCASAPASDDCGSVLASELLGSVWSFRFGGGLTAIFLNPRFP